MRGRTLTLKIKYADFQQITRSRTLFAPLPHRDQAERLAQELLRAQLPVPQGVRLLGLTLSNLESQEDLVGQQLGLAL